MGYIDKNGITFNSFDSNASAFKKKLSNTQYAGASVNDLADIANDNGGILPTTINAVEIDWNSAKLDNVELPVLDNGNTVNTTGQLLALINDLQEQINAIVYIMNGGNQGGGSTGGTTTTTTSSTITPPPGQITTTTSTSSLPPGNIQTTPTPR